MIPSKYQLSVFSHVELLCKDNCANLLVQAVAGSGKTTTIVRALEKVPQHFSVLFCCFNKHIAEALIPKIPRNTQAATLNSVGWRICLANCKPKLEKFKTEILYKNLFNFNSKSERDEFYRTKGTVTRLVSLLKANCHTQPLEFDIKELADQHGIEPNLKLIHDTMIVYQHCLIRIDIMDFDDQVFMPWYKNWQFPQYDLLMVDESQDLNPIMAEFISRLSKRFVCVGDSRQAIYGFRGADPESMNNLKRRLNAVELPLSICYRCPKKVVEEAKKIVPHIEWSPDAKDGVVEDIGIDDFRQMTKADDYVLCRTTAPLVSECLKAIKAGKRAAVKGRDIGEGIADLVMKLAWGAEQDIEEFNLALRDWHNKQRERLAKLEKEDQIIVLDDQVDTIDVLAENCDTVDEILERIEMVFPKEIPGQKLEGIIFCTVHRSKGLEAKNIFILHPELMPHPAAKKEWQQVQEINLLYVAITRSLENLYWIKTGVKSLKGEKGL